MSEIITPLTGVAFLAFPEMKERLLRELKARFPDMSTQYKEYGDLIYCPDWQLAHGTIKTPYGSYNLPYWAKITYLEPFLAEFESIGMAARLLKQMQRNWAPYQYTQFRRAALIQETLPYINLKTRRFPCSIPASNIGAYTNIDKNNLIASAKTSSYLPTGTIVLEEDHINPPSRAYLKLQEALILSSSIGGGCFKMPINENELPQPYAVPLPSKNMRCLDAGGSPGGWTWVLRQFGCDVTAIDRTELSPSLMADKKVSFIKHDAFSLTPEQLGVFDWIFSDIICYPERLLEWIHMWIDSKAETNMICTIKMQGEINWGTIAHFANIRHSRIVHLNYNKHEFTWIYTR
ncbi:MAG TPA: SAM-dependent methyltransferase [Treponemataceae bacterium]|nr:SAM-dependent methyltransferase [Treponemataceae bacterium]